MRGWRASLGGEGGRGDGVAGLGLVGLGFGEVGEVEVARGAWWAWGCFAPAALTRPIPGGCRPQTPAVGLNGLQS